MTIRVATAADAEGLWQAHVASIRGLCAGWYPDAEIAAWTGLLAAENYRIGVQDHVMLVAEGPDGAVVGFGELDLERAEVRAVYVLPAVAQTGTGSVLLARLEQIARDHGLVRLTLCASLNAEAFYRRRGWSPGAREKHRLTAALAVDCVRMDKALSA